MTERVFVKSSYSGHPQNDCVEVGTSILEQNVLLRDSKHGQESPLIETSPEAFTAFVGGLATQESFAQSLY